MTKHLGNLASQRDIWLSVWQVSWLFLCGLHQLAICRLTQSIYRHKIHQTQHPNLKVYMWPQQQEKKFSKHPPSSRSWNSSARRTSFDFTPADFSFFLHFVFRDGWMGESGEIDDITDDGEEGLWGGFHIWRPHTGLGKRVGPRLGVSCLLIPSGRGWWVHAT